MSRYVVFDSHCDTAYELWRKRQTLEKTDCMVSLPQMEQLKGYGQFFAFCTLAGLDTGYSCEALLSKPYAYFMEELRRHTDTMTLCRTGTDFTRALAEGKCGVFLSLEGAEGIACDPGRLDELFEMGIRMVNLTWNADNALAGCAKTDGPGLTRQGRDFVHRAQKLGIIIDVSHISDRAFWDVLETAERPVVASHSNSRSLCGHARNLTDAQFQALCQQGGYAGINLYSAFLEDSERADFESVYRHMDHFLQLGGGHVALGGDLDGCDRLPAGFQGVKDYNGLASFLEQKGFSEQTIQDIYSNTMKRTVTLCTM